MWKLSLQFTSSVIICLFSLAYVPVRKIVKSIKLLYGNKIMGVGGGGGGVGSKRERERERGGGGRVDTQTESESEKLTCEVKTSSK